MRWIRAVALVVLVLLLPTTSGAPFLQPGVDAYNSGEVHDPGPAFLDILTSIDIPAITAYAPPLIQWPFVYVLGLNLSGPLGLPEPFGSGTNATHENGVWRVDVRDLQMEKIVHGPEGDPGSAESVYGFRRCFGSDGERIFAAWNQTLHAYRLPDGQEEWTYPLGDAVREASGHAQTACEDLRVLETGIVVAYSNAGDPAVVHLDGDGAVLGEVLPDAFRASPVGVDNGGPVSYLDPSAVDVRVAAYHEGVAVLISEDFGASEAVDLWIVDEAWKATLVESFSYPTSLDQNVDETYQRAASRILERPAMAVLDDAVYVNGDRLWVYSPAGTTETRLGAPPPYGPGDGIVVADGVAFGRAHGELHRIESETIVTHSRSVSSHPDDKNFLVRGDMIVHASQDGIHLLDVTDLSPRDALGASTVGGWARWVAIGDGLMAASLEQGLTIIGHSEASPSVKAHVPQLYPPTASAAAIEWDAEPGVLGGDVEIVVDWGDGAVEHVADTGFATHHYQDGDYQGTVTVETSSGQMRTTSFVIHPGGSPERSPTFLETAFNQDNQETSFFVLGLLATLLFAAFGFLRLRRRRSLLAKELEAVDDEVRALGGDAPAVREALRQRRNRARRLFLEGRLDEGSTSLLERHIDEKLRDHRLGAAEKEFAFLPYALFRAMQEILRDARVNDWELETFRERLDAEPTLTATQRRKVRRRVKAWHAEDRV